MWEMIAERMIDALAKAVLREGSARRRFIRATTRLWHCMNRCHQEYRKWKSTPDAGQHAPRDPVDNARWRPAIEELILALWEMRDTLGIFNPPVFSALRGYVAGEVESYYRPSAIRIDELGHDELAKYELLVSSVWRDACATPEFEKALATLGEFMRQHLKPEELHM